MVPLSDIFDIEYGNKLDANKANFQSEGINFVSRSSKNLGVIGKVEEVDGATVFEAGLITVTLGVSMNPPIFAQTRKSLNFRYPRAVGRRISRQGEPCARRRSDLISFRNF